MLTKEQIEKNYNTFKKYIKGYITRQGVDEFLAWLDTTDCKVAPASTKYHGAFEGGLVKHLLNVFNRVFKYMKTEYDTLENCPYSKDTLAFVSLLHDINKVNFYKPYYKNVQNNENGMWEKELAFTTRDDIMLGSQEENAIQVLNRFFRLTDEETYAIRYHMGYSESGDSFYRNNMLNCYSISLLAIVLHQQDEWSIARDETEREQLISSEKAESKQDIAEEKQDIETPAAKPAVETPVAKKTESKSVETNQLVSDLMAKYGDDSISAPSSVEAPF